MSVDVHQLRGDGGNNLRGRDGNDEPRRSRRPVGSECHMFPRTNSCAFAAALLALMLTSACGSRSSPYEWKTFVKVEGQPYEIPVEWVSTPEGKFAHSIHLPDSIPKPVPFDFWAARLKAVWPGNHNVSRQYWEHLCSTEAGSFILKTVDNVDGFVFLRFIPGLSVPQQNDRWSTEAPKLQSHYGFKNSPKRDAIGYVNPPHHTYLYVEYPDPEQVSSFWKLSGFIDRKQDFTVERLTEPGSRYAVTWRGIRRFDDREHLIAGHELIVLDRQSNEVLAVFRDFGITGFTTNRPEGIYWENAGQCPFNRKVMPRPEIYGATAWIPRVLKPAVYPDVLKFIDQTLEKRK